MKDGFLANNNNMLYLKNFKNGRESRLLPILRHAPAWMGKTDSIREQKRLKKKKKLVKDGDRRKIKK